MVVYERYLECASGKMEVGVSLVPFIIGNGSNGCGSASTGKSFLFDAALKGADVEGGVWIAQRCVDVGVVFVAKERIGCWSKLDDVGNACVEKIEIVNEGDFRKRAEDCVDLRIFVIDVSQVVACFDGVSFLGQAKIEEKEAEAAKAIAAKGRFGAVCIEDAHAEMGDG